jgi:hypothetical protein
MAELAFGQLMQPEVRQVKLVEAMSSQNAVAMSVVGGMPIIPNSTERTRLPASALMGITAAANPFPQACA